ncbi:flagellar filament capping protein FliD [Clostridium sp. HCP1S3_B4]|uniref:flagellar filament capping protein FliD n=1 Tax=unclassified Clostridium TaxID=2614128 RepID=UPI003F88CE23
MATSANRITGIATGLDIDSIVKSSMQAYQNKIDKQKKQKSLAEIKQQLYRDVITEGRDFYDKYCDLAKSGNLLSSSSYSTVKFTSSDEFSITATGGADAVKGNYKVTVKEAGSKAKTSISDLSGDIKITVGGKEVFIQGSELTGSNKEKAKVLSNKLSAYGLKAYVSDFDSKEGTKDAGNIIIEANEVGAEYDFTIEKGTYKPEKNPEKFTLDNSTKKSVKDESFGIDDLLNDDSKYLQFTNFENKDRIIESRTLKSSIKSIEDKIAKANEELGKLTDDSEKEAKKQEIEQLEKEKVNELSSTINSSLKEIGLKAEISTDSDGKTSIKISDKNSVGNDFSYCYGKIGPNFETDDTIKNTVDGKKAKVIIEGPHGTKTIEDARNKITLDGVTFDISSAKTGDSVTVSGKTDTKEIKDKIVNMVNDYNKYMTKLNTLLTEKKYRDYEPLTDEQKKEMKDTEIEAWEKKVKSGQLRGDSDLRRIQNSMKLAMTSFVSGAGITLSDIGITQVSDYGSTKDGLMTIDEDKLTSALENNSEEVMKLFTQKGDTDGTTGIMYRMKDVLNTEVVSTTKSALINKAGIEGTTSFTQSTLSKLISEYEKKIDELQDWYDDKEQALYTKWANIETLMNNYNSQSSYLTSMFSSGS